MPQDKFFSLGQVVSTNGAAKKLDGADVLEALSRHKIGDWGDCCAEDKDQNDLALIGGQRLVSVYHDKHETRFYIITEWDRSITTILLPEEY